MKGSGKNFLEDVVNTMEIAPTKSFTGHARRQDVGENYIYPLLVPRTADNYDCKYEATKSFRKCPKIQMRLTGDPSEPRDQKCVQVA